MTVLGVYSIKGGVGTTSSTVNPSHLATAEGCPTLALEVARMGLHRLPLPTYAPSSAYRACWKEAIATL